MAHLTEKVEPFSFWNILRFFRAKRPLVGALTGAEGLVRVRDIPFSASSLRALSFRVEDVEGRSSLRGVLRLRLSLLLYEVLAVLAFMCFDQLSTIYWALATRHPLSLALIGNLLRPFLFIPFLWCYIRFGLWIGRKREAELIEVQCERPSTRRESHLCHLRLYAQSRLQLLPKSSFGLGNLWIGEGAGASHRTLSFLRQSRPGAKAMLILLTEFVG